MEVNDFAPDKGRAARTVPRLSLHCTRRFEHRTAYMTTRGPLWRQKSTIIDDPVLEVDE
jgi:hypothetical protein